MLQFVILTFYAIKNILIIIISWCSFSKYSKLCNLPVQRHAENKVEQQLYANWLISRPTRHNYHDRFM